MPIEQVKKERRYRAFIGAICAVGLIYMGISIAVMNHLVQENNAFCLQRAASREAIRTLFEGRSDWKIADQVFMDTHLPPSSNC